MPLRAVLVSRNGSDSKSNSGGPASRLLIHSQCLSSVPWIERRGEGISSFDLASENVRIACSLNRARPFSRDAYPPRLRGSFVTCTSSHSSNTPLYMSASSVGIVERRARLGCKLAIPCALRPCDGWRLAVAVEELGRPEHDRRCSRHDQTDSRECCARRRMATSPDGEQAAQWRAGAADAAGRDCQYYLRRPRTWEWKSGSVITLDKVQVPISSPRENRLAEHAERNAYE